MATRGGSLTMQSFKNESDISHVFSIESCIRGKFNYNEWHSWEVKELKGLFGIPDHFAIFWKKDILGRLIQRTFSFEMKKSNWKRALVQAYRYASFSEYSFVVLDHYYIHRALAYRNEFKNANIGLISIRVDGKVFWHIRPRYRKPYSKHMWQLLREGLTPHLFGDDKIEPNKRLQWSY